MFSYRRLAVVLVPVLLALLVAIGWSVGPGLPFSRGQPGPMMHVVERGEFLYDITDRGSVESANNVEIRCEVKSKNTSGTTILEIIEEGSTVEAGDLLVKLDDSSLEDQLTQQQIVCNTSEARVIKARNDYETALIAQREYLEGKYKQEVQLIQSEIFVAEENLRRAQENLQYSKRLAAKGYVTELQVEADRFAVDKAGNELESAKTKLEVLQKFTKEMKLKELESNIKTSEAALRSEQASHNLDLERLALVEDQIEKCVIKAPEAGQVVYANVPGGRGRREVILEEGAQVREGQVIIRLPDSSDMQVNARINEAKVTLLKVGMPVTILLDAFPDYKLKGKVERIDEFPAPTSWYNANIKEYETIIRVGDPLPGMRPGLTAEVKIHVEQLTNVLRVPVQTIFEHGSKYYCVVQEGKGFRPHELKIGSTNDKFVVIREGLKEGRQIVLNAAAHRDKLDLPKLPSDDQRPPPPGPPGPSPSDSPPAGRLAPGHSPPAKPSAESIADRTLKKLDANSDGRLELNELPQAIKARLSAADSNGDGVIDRGELTAAMSRMISRGGKPRAPGAAP